MSTAVPLARRRGRRRLGLIICCSALLGSTVAPLGLAKGALIDLATRTLWAPA